MSIILWIVFGAIAGFIADFLDRSVSLSWIERIVVGIVGAFVGGIIATLLTTGELSLTASADFNIISLIIAVLGALLALFAWKKLKPQNV